MEGMLKSNEEKLSKKLATSFQKNIFARKIAKVDERKTGEWINWHISLFILNMFQRFFFWLVTSRERVANSPNPQEE